MISMSTIGFSIMPDILVWPKSNLNIALWVKFKIADIFLRKNNKLNSPLSQMKADS